MDEIINRISERLATKNSRRSFFSTMGKAVLGVAAIVTGQGFFAQAAHAAGLQCCTGPAACPGSSCPPNTHITYVWSCGNPFDGDAGDYYTCHDCYHQNRLVCVYATAHD